LVIGGVLCCSLLAGAAFFAKHRHDQQLLDEANNSMDMPNPAYDAAPPMPAGAGGAGLTRVAVSGVHSLPAVGSYATQQLDTTPLGMYQTMPVAADPYNRGSDGIYQTGAYASSTQDMYRSARMDTEDMSHYQGYQTLQTVGGSDSSYGQLQITPEQYEQLRLQRESQMTANGFVANGSNQFRPYVAPMGMLVLSLLLLRKIS
jgi:hypothetical protein